MRILVLALLAFLIASPAEAGPVVGAIQMIAVAIKGFAGLNWFTAFLVRTGLSIGFSLLAQAVRGKPRAQGITADSTTTGVRELHGYEVKGGDVIIAGLGDDRIPMGRACIGPLEIGAAINKAPAMPAIAVSVNSSA